MKKGFFWVSGKIYPVSRLREVATPVWQLGPAQRSENGAWMASGPVAVSTTSLPNGIVNPAYSAVIHASGGYVTYPERPDTRTAQTTKKRLFH